MAKPRVFVSSVMDNFSEFREAARTGILSAGGEPVLVEDYPSQASSSRTACLDGVASSDALVVVIGRRGGWTTPSGKLVVEEEYDEARRRKIPVLLFVQSVPDRDERAQDLADRLSNYVDGLFRKTFISPAELQELVSKSLVPVIEHKGAPMSDTVAFNRLLSDATKMGDETVMRFVLMPERNETLIDTIEIASDKFRNGLMALAHAPEVGLFSYERPKKFETGMSSVSIMQIGGGDRRDAKDMAFLSVTTTGTVIIDTNVTGRTQYRSTERNPFGPLYYLLESDLTGRLAPSFAFADALYAIRDTFKRYDRFLYNVVLHNVGQRTLVTQIPNTASVTVPQSIATPVAVFDAPQILNREELADPTTQIETILNLLRRRVKPRDWFGQPL